MKRILKQVTYSFNKHVSINTEIQFNSMNEIAFAFVLLYEVTEIL